MADSKRVIRPLFSVLIVVATALGLYNVYADNSDVVTRAKIVACGDPDCKATRTQEGRDPFGQSFTFQTKKGEVNIRCARSLYLLGEYSCERR